MIEIKLDISRVFEDYEGGKGREEKRELERVKVYRIKVNLLLFSCFLNP